MTWKCKRLKGALEGVDLEKEYSLDQALSLLADYKKSSVKFDESIDVAIRLGIDPRQSDQQIRGAVSMPNGLGKDIKVALVVAEDQLTNAQKAGADIVGSTDLMEKIKGGFTDFDVCIATPSVMPQLSKFGKVLGPKGLMPNPKLGTVTDDVAGAVKAAKAGKVEYRAEKAGIVHASIGKLSFDAKSLKENMMELYKAILAAKPSSVKGSYVKGFVVSATMGPSIKLDLSTIIG